MKTCLSELELAEYLDQSTPPDDSDSPGSAHIASCPKCQERVEAERLFRDLKKVVGKDSKADTEKSLSSTHGISFAVETSDRFPTIPGYRIESKIEGGGQGVVYRAHQLSTHRDVAIKVLRESKVAQLEKRNQFKKEIETVASFQHPNIVTLYESGTVNGLIYYSMELIDGVPLDQFCKTNLKGEFDGGKTSSRHVHNILVIFLQILDAIAFAHRRGIVHRDLKPANILVDANGSPKVLDFGLAKISDLFHEDGRPQEQNVFFGTPAYSSPEQFDGAANRLDTRSDVYSLGVILYELLTQRTPCRVKGSFGEVMSAIREQVPTLPESLNRSVKSDVSRIIMKMLAKDPGERYQSVEGVANDIDSYLNGKPIEARRDNRLYVFQKLVNRNRLVFALTLIVFVSLITALLFSNRYYQQAIQDRDLAVKSMEAANLASREAATQRTIAEYEACIANLAAAAGAIQLDDVVECTSRLMAIPEKLRGWEWHHFLHELDDSEKVLAHFGTYATFAAFGRDSNEVISAGADGKLLITYVDGSQPNRELDRETPGPVAVSPDGKRLAMSGINGTIQLIQVDDLQTGFAIQTGGNTVTALSFHPDSKFISIGVAKTGPTSSTGIAIEVWDLEKQALVRSLPFLTWHVNGISISADQEKLAAITYEGGSIYEMKSGRRLTKLPDRPGNEVAICFKENGEEVFTGGEDGVIYGCDPLSGKTRIEYRGHRGEVTDIKLSAASGMLFTASRDKTIRTWNPETGRLVDTQIGHQWGITSLDVDRQGKRLVTSSWDKSTRIWKTHDADDKSGANDHANQIVSVCFSAHGSVFATGSRDGTVKIWRTRDQKFRRSLSFDQPVHGVQFSSDDKLLAVTGWDGHVSVFKTKNWELAGQLTGHEMDSRVHGICFAHENKSLITGGSDNQLIVWDLESMQKKTALTGHDDHIHSLAVSFDGQYLASAGHRSIRIWSLNDYTLLHVFERTMLQDDFSLAFHPTKNLLAAGADVGLVNLWNVENGKLVAKYSGHNDEIKSLDFYPDGTRLVTCSFDNRVIIWDTSTHRQLLSLFGYSAPTNILKFDPTGFYLVGGLQDGSIKMWRGITVKDFQEKKNPKDTE